MDDADLLDEIHRRELERKLRSIPAGVLETACVREAQIEAVIDAVLTVSYAADAAAYAHARHVGEWSARIASVLHCGPDERFVRRVGVLADVDATALERIEELKHFAPFVSDYQKHAVLDEGTLRTPSLIVAVADEFETLIATDNVGHAISASAALRTMIAIASEGRRPIVEALAIAAGFLQRSFPAPHTKQSEHIAYQTQHLVRWTLA